MSNNKNKKKRALPLAPPPAMRSRKKARKVTTKFHALTRDREQAQLKNDTRRIQEIDEELTKLGGRQEYQRASQLSTSHHSTSKWVIGKLAQAGWLYGIREEHDTRKEKKKRKVPRRKTRLLEVGAINTELLTAAKETVPSEDGTVSKYRLDVRAIDLHSMHEGIEEADFLTFPLDKNGYDVVVCSMVINCVPTPEQRGTMLARLFHQLRPGGLCFFTLPKLCLTQSPYTTPERFQSMLSDNGGVGFEVVETKESPKVSFFVLRRALLNRSTCSEAAAVETKNRLDAQWTTARRINKGKQYRNPFAVILNEEEVNGTSLV